MDEIKEDIEVITESPATDESDEDSDGIIPLDSSEKWFIWISVVWGLITLGLIIYLFM